MPVFTILQNSSVYKGLVYNVFRWKDTHFIDIWD